MTLKKKCQKIEGMQAGALGRREGRAREGGCVGRVRGTVEPCQVKPVSRLAMLEGPGTEPAPLPAPQKS